MKFSVTKTSQPDEAKKIPIQKKEHSPLLTPKAMNTTLTAGLLTLPHKHLPSHIATVAKIDVYLL